jgi:NADPH-dependent 2,4-dienoyl-CoA reductase/sulfur reductase-like enzyme
MTGVLIIGGSDAGISAALRARELDPVSEVTVVVADAYPNYSICGLPFFLSGETADWHDLAHRKAPDIEAHGITLRLEHVARHVDAATRTVIVVDPGGNEQALGYDELVIGTGAVPIRPAIEGLELPGVHVLHTMQHSFEVHRQLETGDVRRAVIIGAGYIGVEMCDALTHHGIRVTVVEQLPSVLTTVDPELGTDIAAELTRHGVNVATSTKVDRVIEKDGHLCVMGDHGFEEPADLVLVVVGVRPDVDLARTAGVELGERGAIRVDRGMRTNVPHVYAAGDCVHTWHQLTEHYTYMPLGTTSHKQGRVAGENAVGGRREYAGSLGTQVVKTFDVVAARTGLREHEAIAAGYEPFTIDRTFDDHKAYYPGATPLRIRLTGDRGSGRLLGAQLLGRYGAEVSKRVDIYATALLHHMTIDGLADLDLSYTPPLSSPWDPTQMAALAWELERTT